MAPDTLSCSYNTLRHPLLPPKLPNLAELRANEATARRGFTHLDTLRIRHTAAKLRTEIPTSYGVAPQPPQKLWAQHLQVCSSCVCRRGNCKSVRPFQGFDTVCDPSRQMLWRVISAGLGFSVLERILFQPCI